MIKYNLTCKCGKTFESWFSSSKEFSRLSKKKLIKCIDCNSSSIKKSIESYLENELVDRDPNDSRDAFVEIRAGTGGEEAAIFVGDLFKTFE